MPTKHANHKEHRMSTITAADVLSILTDALTEANELGDVAALDGLTAYEVVVALSTSEAIPAIHTIIDGTLEVNVDDGELSISDANTLAVLCYAALDTFIAINNYRASRNIPALAVTALRVSL